MASEDAEMGDLVLELERDAERARAPVEDLSRGRAEPAAEAVAADAVDRAAKMDLDVVPVGEMALERAIGLAVVGLEIVERLVGEDHAEAEGVFRPVALEHGDVRARPRLLHQDGEVEAGRAPADDVHLHARLRGTGESPRCGRPGYFKPKIIGRQA